MSPERGHDGHIARKLDCIAQSLVGIKQYGLAFERLITKPKGLGKAATGEAERRCFPTGLASQPAPLKVSGQQLKQREIPDRVRIVRVDRQRFAKGCKSFIQQLQAPQRPCLFVQRCGKIRTKFERAIDAR
ncbi:hypothetical protein Q2941_08435 [Bradyrhizobium sp. UFLA05-153]